jgi:hypothetical protein
VGEHVGIALEMGAAVEVEDLAGEPGRLVRAEEEDGLSDVLGDTDPAEWGVLVLFDAERARLTCLPTPV